MKTRAQIAVVDQMEHHLTLAEPLAAALGLGEGSELKWIVLVPNESEHAWYESDLTLIASTMPVRSWGRLMRGSFNLKPGPGSAAALIANMERLSLYVRHFQIEESVIAAHHLRSPAGNRPFLCEASHSTVPTALLTSRSAGPRTSSAQAWPGRCSTPCSRSRTGRRRATRWKAR